MLLSRNSSQVDGYYELAREGRVFVATADVTAPVAFGTKAAMGGPLLWNNSGPGLGGSQRVMAVILGVSVGWTTAPAASGAMGLTWGSGQASAPSSTRAIDGSGATVPGASPQRCNVYRIGTVANAGATILITHEVSKAANPSSAVFVPINGLVQVPPSSWASVAGAAAISRLVATVSLIWAEVLF